ncbi:diphthamide biosynthesis protein [Rhizoctonia solani]|uniref:2-(3-amino-3-carboxypropyl)histidine synthase subunit 1 n=1 Tax=Rhizoctonia solani TaxID=456999 RepID=A0A8H8NQI6_9AGAM|nr:diphthamide biosynthesis protein [Rhizoctonia solani]QRW16457.1 diphthamide biosynthesis protein [Rhizoctonia solani]
MSTEPGPAESSPTPTTGTSKPKPKLNPSTNASPNPKPRKRFVGRTSKPGAAGTLSGTIANQIPESILRDPLLQAAADQLPRNYSFEIHKTVHHVRKNGAKMVALQMPEGLQMYACTVADIIESADRYHNDQDIYIFVEIAIDSEHLTNTIRMNFPSSRHTFRERLLTDEHIPTGEKIHSGKPALAIEAAPEDTKGKSKAPEEDQPTRLALVSTIQFVAAVQRLKDDFDDPSLKAAESGRDPRMHGSKVVQRRRCTGLCGDGRFHLEAMMIANPAVPAFRYDPYSKKLTRERYDHAEMREVRAQAVRTATQSLSSSLDTAGRWGVILGYTAPVTDFAAHGPLRPDPALGALAGQAGVFRASHFGVVQTSCPRLSIDWGPADAPDAHDAYRYDDRPAGAYDQYNGGSPNYQAQSPLPGAAHPPPPPPPPQEYPPSTGTSPHTPAQLPGHPHAPPPPHPAYHDVAAPGYHPAPSALYSASTYGNLNGQGLDPAELPNDLSALADAHPGQKPPYPYSTIIRYAIQGSPRQRLTLSELYDYGSPQGVDGRTRYGNLSLNRCFEKVPRPITEPGKGSYWTVNLNGPEGTRRVRNDAGSQGPSATDTASPSAPTPSPPPPITGANSSPLPPPGQNGYPSNWSNENERWQQQHTPTPQPPPPPGQNGYLQYPPVARIATLPTRLILCSLIANRRVDIPSSNVRSQPALGPTTNRLLRPGLILGQMHRHRKRPCHKHTLLPRPRRPTVSVLYRPLPNPTRRVITRA